MKKFMDVFINNFIPTIPFKINTKTIEYTDMNIDAPTFKHNIKDLVIVTSFLDINRENWINSYKRTTTQYIESFINYFNEYSE